MQRYFIWHVSVTACLWSYESYEWMGAVRPMQRPYQNYQTRWPRRVYIVSERRLQATLEALPNTRFGILRIRLPNYGRCTKNGATKNP